MDAQRVWVCCASYVRKGEEEWKVLALDPPRTGRAVADLLGDVRVRACRDDLSTPRLYFAHGVGRCLRLPDAIHAATSLATSSQHQKRFTHTRE